MFGAAAAAVAVSTAVLHPRLHAQDDGAKVMAGEARATIGRYCVTCHNNRLRTAGLSLADLDFDDLPAQAEIWEKVAAKLRTGEMPPAGAPRPAATAGRALATWVEATLDRAAAANPNPGRPAIHRLNRVEYANAIRDLLALEVDSRSLLPTDDQAFGFDNIAATLTISPGLMDRYLLAARRIARLAVGDPSLGPVVESYRAARLQSQDDRLAEEMPFGTRGGLSIRHHFPLDGEYVLRIRTQGATSRTAGELIDVRLDGERVALLTTPGRTSQIVGEGAPDAQLEARFAAKAGPRTIGVALVKRTVAPEGLTPAYLPVGNISFRITGIGAVEIEGPFNAAGLGDTPSRQRIFVCRPGLTSKAAVTTAGVRLKPDTTQERACAYEILAKLARRAYRRPINDGDLATLLAFFEDGHRDGFDAGIRAAVERILIDPEFLLRVERDPAGAKAGQAYRISDLELASRLSFFLWSSIPDDELIEAAAGGWLREPAMLDRQIGRMLADPRARALVTSFAAQWLHLRNLRAATPDANEFPDFDDNLREAFQRETELFLESQLRDDRSVVDLLTADYTFVNERLARHYGIANVYGSHFRRVSMPRPERHGLLGHGSILTVTSYATRTSPVVRGKWLLENVLGAPPPAPPPDVPALKENDESSQALSVRERMEQHRANTVCASCHARMDPLGFALENFDAIGRWRTAAEDGQPIDASGALPDGTTFDGPVALRELLLSRRDEFVMTIAEKMLTYAIGRGLEAYDRPALRKIVRASEPAGSTWSSLVRAIVMSAPFQMRKTGS
jgi:mono/diheme cytochrome c family protein